MSILQEYEIIRKSIGEEKFGNIERFLDEHKEYLLSDVYYTFDGWNTFSLWEINDEKDLIKKRLLQEEYDKWIKSKNHNN